ncbi:MAG: hypothetical protein M0026_18860 [Nocardiopsaceae bacterium]|nr:hypothetical protein [Nocardiopsaceae bacterium]
MGARHRSARSWGRRLITVSALATAITPWIADWNRRHTFGPGYGPHARWHGTAEVVSATGEGLLMLWLVRGDPNDQGWRSTTAAALPIIRWGAFNVVLPVPGTSPYDDPGRPVRIAGVPAAVAAQNSIAALALIGWCLTRYGSADRPRPRRCLQRSRPK